jgi:hypothetical protein
VNIWLAGIRTCCATTAAVVHAVCGTAHDEKPILRSTYAHYRLGGPPEKENKKKLVANPSTNYNLETGKLSMYVSEELGEIKTLLVTPKEHRKKSFEKSLQRMVKIQVNRKRAYIYVSKQGRKIMQRSLVLVLER